MSSSGSSHTSNEDPSVDTLASSPAEVELLYHHEIVGSEPIEYYEPGGVHPIKIDTVLQGASTTYRIVAKLGWGAFSTVWLAKCCGSTRWAALKICRADSPPLHEVAMLRYVNAGSAAPHVSTLLDNFTIHGPNGTHTVIVTDVVAPIQEEIGYFWRGNAAALKAIARSVVDAVVHVHAGGVAHGDLHFNNIAFVKPWLEDDDPKFAEFAAKATLFPVFSCGADVEFDPHIPPYIVREVHLVTYERLFLQRGQSPSSVKLLDFGGARCISNADGVLEQCHEQIRSPEWLLGPTTTRMATTASDVWALGLAIYRIMACGRSLNFGGLMGIARYSGVVPTSWLASDAWNDSFKPDSFEVSATQADELWAQASSNYLRENCASDDEAFALVRLLRRCLSLDPADRPSAADILMDPWFASEEQVDSL